MDTSTATTFTIVVADPDEAEATFRAVSTDDAGNVTEDYTYTVPPEAVPTFCSAFMAAVNAARVLGDEVDNLADPALAAVEASFPTGAQLDAEDELRDRLTAEGIAHGNF